MGQMLVVRLNDEFPLKVDETMSRGRPNNSKSISKDPGTVLHQRDCYFAPRVDVTVLSVFTYQTERLPGKVQLVKLGMEENIPLVIYQPDLAHLISHVVVTTRIVSPGICAEKAELRPFFDAIVSWGNEYIPECIFQAMFSVHLEDSCDHFIANHHRCLEAGLAEVNCFIVCTTAAAERGKGD